MPAMRDANASQTMALARVALGDEQRVLAELGELDREAELVGDAPVSPRSSGHRGEVLTIGVPSGFVPIDLVGQDEDDARRPLRRRGSGAVAARCRGRGRAIVP